MTVDFLDLKVKFPGVIWYLRKNPDFQVIYANIFFRQTLVEVMGWLTFVPPRSQIPAKITSYKSSKIFDQTVDIFNQSLKEVAHSLRKMAYFFNIWRHSMSLVGEGLISFYFFKASCITTTWSTGHSDWPRVSLTRVELRPTGQWQAVNDFCLSSRLKIL